MNLLWARPASSILRMMNWARRPAGVQLSRNKDIENQLTSDRFSNPMETIFFIKKSEHLIMVSQWHHAQVLAALNGFEPPFGYDASLHLFFSKSVIAHQVPNSWWKPKVFKNHVPFFEEILAESRADGHEAGLLPTCRSLNNFRVDFNLSLHSRSLQIHMPPFPWPCSGMSSLPIARPGCCAFFSFSAGACHGCSQRCRDEQWDSPRGFHQYLTWSLFPSRHLIQHYPFLEGWPNSGRKARWWGEGAMWEIWSGVCNDIFLVHATTVPKKIAAL